MGQRSEVQPQLVEGLNNADMISWGTGRLPWEIKDNYVCNPTSKNMIHEEGDWKQTPPLQSGNVISTTCAARASSAPTIAKPNGTYSAPTQVTLIDVGFTAAVGPLATPRSTTQPTVAARPPRRGPIQALSQLRHVYGESDGNVGSGANPKELPGCLRICAERGAECPLCGIGSSQSAMARYPVAVTR